jgi:hypothetical protein
VTFRDPYRSIWQGVEQNVLARRILAIPEYREAYLAALEECIHSAEGPGGWLEQQMERTYEQINVATLEDTHAPYPFTEFQLNIDMLRNYIRERPTSLLQQIDESRQSRLFSRRRRI